MTCEIQIFLRGRGRVGAQSAQILLKYEKPANYCTPMGPAAKAG
jgi:hypothetical protein